MLWGTFIPGNRQLCDNWFWVKHFSPWLINVRAKLSYTEVVHAKQWLLLHSPVEGSGAFQRKWEN